MWERIESAPTDGTPFLAYDEHGPPAHTMAVCYLSESGTLCFDATGEIIDTDVFQPTHWMPVPRPPGA